MFEVRTRRTEIFLLILVVIGCTCLSIGFWQMRVTAQTPDAPATATAKAAGYGDAIGYESISITNTATAFTAATYTTDVKKAFCTLETANIRFRIDGTDPTSTEGHLMASGNTLVLYGYSQIVRFKGIRTGSTSGTLKVTYMK